MAVIKLSDTVANNTLTQINNALNAGSGPGTIKIYSGLRPAGPSVAPSGGNLLLAELTCSDPAGFVGSRSLTFSMITQDSSANNSGTASWARLADSDGVGVADVDVSPVGGGGFLQMNTTTIVANGPVLINSFVISV